MSPRRIARRWLATFVVGTVAPLVLAQTGPGARGPHGRGAAPAIAKWQACSTQADARRLPPGDARKAFTDECMKSGADDNTPANGRRDAGR